MFSFTKFGPTDYVIHFQRGRIRREGRGLSFFYWMPTSSIVSVPVASSDIPFVFQLLTSDFQTVTVQGQLTYRVTEYGDCGGGEAPADPRDADAGGDRGRRAAQGAGRAAGRERAEVGGDEGLRARRHAQTAGGGMEWEKLVALNGGADGPRIAIAHAFRQLAENAQRIGTLNITPDLLQSLLTDDAKP